MSSCDPGQYAIGTVPYRVYQVDECASAILHKCVCTLRTYYGEAKINGDASVTNFPNMGILKNTTKICELIFDRIILVPLLKIVCQFEQKVVEKYLTDSNKKLIDR